jgi:hypothetical protein
MGTELSRVFLLGTFLVQVALLFRCLKLNGTLGPWSSMGTLLLRRSSCMQVVKQARRQLSLLKTQVSVYVSFQSSMFHQAVISEVGFPECCTQNK